MTKNNNGKGRSSTVPAILAFARNLTPGQLLTKIMLGDKRVVCILVMNCMTDLK